MMAQIATLPSSEKLGSYYKSRASVYFYQNEYFRTAVIFETWFITVSSTKSSGTTYMLFHTNITARVNADPVCSSESSLQKISTCAMVPIYIILSYNYLQVMKERIPTFY